MKKYLLISIVLVLLVLGSACRIRDSAATPTPTEEASVQPTEVSSTVTPSPTFTLTPTPRSTPEATPTAPLYSPSDNLGEIAFSYTQRFVEELGARESASDREEAAANFIAAELTELGYNAEMQEFTVQRYDTTEPFVAISSPVEESIEARFVHLSGTGEASASIVQVGFGEPDDFPEEGLNGKIALIQRGLLFFEDKVQNAQNAGASAAIIYNNEEAELFATLSSAAEIPALTISQADGERLVEMLEEGEVVLDVRLLRFPTPSRNVVASRIVSGFKTIVIGAHMDTVSDVDGANDNGSGIGLLLALAQETAKLKTVPYSIHFIAFGSEEIGLLGSANWVNSLSPLGGRSNIRAMLNFDSVGSGELQLQGDQELVDQGLSLAAGLGLDVSRGQLPRGGASDHDVFLAVGIPAMIFSGTDISRIHTAEDTLEFIDQDLLSEAARLGIAMLDYFAEEGASGFRQPEE